MARAEDAGEEVRHLALPTGENSRGQNPYRLREANALFQLSYPTAGMDWRRMQSDANCSPSTLSTG
jgi:hypothetical protein